MARLRTFTFYSLDELNAQLAAFLDEENQRQMANGMPSRRQRFDNIERMAIELSPECLQR